MQTSSILVWVMTIFTIIVLSPFLGFKAIVIGYLIGVFNTAYLLKGKEVLEQYKKFYDFFKGVK